MIKYFKVILQALWQKMLLTLGVVIVIGAVLAFKNTSIAAAILLPLLAWVILWVLLFLLMASTMKKEEPLEEILIAHGYCDEWLQKHSEIYPNPSRSQKLSRISVLGYLGRYDEAKAMLESLSTFDMNDDQKFEYNVAWLDMLLTTGHYDEGLALLEKCRGWMDTYAGMQPVRGAAYQCNAAVLLAVANDFEGSQKYLEAAERVIFPKKLMSNVIPMIAKTMQLYALDLTGPAEEQEQKTYEYIMSEESQLNQQWQKDHFLSQLGKAKSLTPEKRQEVVS